MILKEKLNKLYESILDDMELTTKNLNQLGFYQKDLHDLIENGKIVRIKRGFYALNSVEGLFYYGKQLIAQKEYDRATKCFEKCFQLDPTHHGVCFQLFLRCIQKKNYKKAFEYFDIFYPSENEFYNADSNFYLYLLSMITELPENHKKYAKYLKFEDFRVDFKDKRYPNVPLQNKIRTSVHHQRFSFALKQLDEAIQEKGSLSVQDITMKALIHQAKEIQMQNKNTVFDFIMQREYEKVIEFYENLSKFHHLSMNEDYILILTQEFLQMEESNRIPQKQIYTAETIYEAIDGKNFELALSLATARNQQYNSNQKDPIFLLLQDIVQKMKEIKENTFQEKEVPATLSSEDITKLVEETQPNVTNFPSSYTFADVFQFLMQQDLDHSFQALKNYLINIGKSEYEFLIVDLIKISLLENDTAFTKPMTTLTFLSRENYTFDLSHYIQEFYIHLAQNKLEEARIYLDILSKSNQYQLAPNCVSVDGLYQVLENTEKLVDEKINNDVLITIDKAFENSKKEILPIKQQEKNTNLQQIEEEKKEMISKEFSKHTLSSSSSNEEKRKLEKEFIAQKHEELLTKKGILLLRPMDCERIHQILEIIEEYSDMKALVIDERNKQQIVLRYKPVLDEYISSKDLIEIGNQAYKIGNYNECIKSYLQLLQFFDEPKSYIYSKIGLSYLMKHQIPLAIDYLTVANNLAKKENLNFDYRDLLAHLKGEIPEEDEKPRFKMMESDFDYSDVSDYYGIDNFEEINTYIIESGLDVESACEQLELSFEETNIIKLIYARKFYIQKNYEKGDLFFKSVEKSKNKTKDVKRIIEEIRKNKRFYQNRQEEKPTKLRLSLIPAKKKAP